MDHIVIRFSLDQLPARFRSSQHPFHLELPECMMSWSNFAILLIH